MYTKTTKLLKKVWPMQKGQHEKVVKSKVVAQKWL